MMCSQVANVVFAGLIVDVVSVVVFTGLIVDCRCSECCCVHSFIVDVMNAVFTYLTVDVNEFTCLL